MRPSPVVFLLLLTTLSAVANAQQTPSRPYAGFEKRSLKTFSDEQISDLRAGRGMGLALAAELNGYPGPVHVLEMADHLELTAEQRAEAQQLHVAMKAETLPLGERLIAQETELENLFATGQITPASLQASVEAIGSTHAALRIAHLRYHLSTLKVLSPHQTHRYRALRGYAGAHSAASPH